MTKRLFSVAFLIVSVIFSAKAGGLKVVNHPDSVFVITYTSGAPTEGIKMAYSADRRTWMPVGENYSFVKSDFSSWGNFKKMYDPSVLYDNGTWYAVWTVVNDVNQFATTQARSFSVWKPQDYPFLPSGQSFLHPHLTKKGKVFHLQYESSDGRQYEIESQDFKKWSTPVPIEKSVYNITARSEQVKVNGRTITGEVHKVPYSIVEELKYKVSDAARRNALYGERADGDRERFRGVQSLKATLQIGSESKEISDNLIGIFFEDINYSADGGLYAELIQNRDFEYNKLDRGEWNAKSFWELEGENATFEISEETPIHKNNSHYAILTSNGKKAALVNEGFDGIVVRKGDKYDLSLFAKSMNGKRQTVVVSITEGNKVLGSSTVKVSDKDWKRFENVVVASADAEKASLKIELQGTGKVGLDFISLFPQKTFKNRKNGLRSDLAQVLADLKPKFVRFPGGCVSHGNGLENMYRWVETVGPLWERKYQSNIWNYHQSKGLGFFEYFQFCEDIGAEPLPVLPAGVCCQNSSRDGHGQQGGLPMEEMESYTQELMDLIEWANGDAKTSKFARMRADAGHPAPFNLKMLGVGNEDLISDVFIERFNYINKRIKAKYPEITIVGTVGPFFEGSDYEYGWQLAKDEHLDIVDEHYYVNPGWYIHNQDYYDKYDREGTKVYLGEWASRGNRLENALCEALHITNLERNGDVVVMSSYAPLLAKQNRTQWNPDLIYFDNTRVRPTVNYYVQKLCGNNTGNRYVYSELSLKAVTEGRNGRIQEGENPQASLRVKSSVVTDAKTGDMIIKLVNITPFDTSIEIQNIPEGYQSKATVSILSGSPSDSDLSPRDAILDLDTSSSYTAPAYSFSVIRLKK